MCIYVHATTHVWKLQDKLWEMVLFSWCESQRLNSRHEAWHGATFPHWPTASAGFISDGYKLHPYKVVQTARLYRKQINNYQGYDGQSGLLPSVPEDYGSDDDIPAAQGCEQLQRLLRTPFVKF